MSVVRSRTRLLVGLGVLAVVVAIGVVAAVRLAAVARDLRVANRIVDEAALALTDGRLGDAVSALERAEDLVLEANDSLRGGFELDLLGWVPGINQNLRSLEDSVDLAATTIHGGIRILHAAEPLQSATGTLEVSLSDGTIPLDAISLVQREIATLSAQLLPMVRAGEPDLLLPQIREARTQVHDEAVDRRRQLEVLGRGLSLLRELAGADGPRRYLVAVANTAEMRGSGGMILNYGVLEGRDGVIDLTAFGRIDELELSEPVSADLVPQDYAARWAGFDPLQRWRQANLAADFTIVAPVLEAMYRSATNKTVDGVIQVDPAGLAAILDGVGAIDVPELGQVTGDNVVDLTLHDAYVRFPGVEERTDVLGDVAEAAFRRLVDGQIPSLRMLATRLVEAVDGRHVLMHADAERVQSVVQAFGADGALPPPDQGDVFSLTAQNLTGNKLDYFLDSRLELRGERPAGDVGSLEATVILTNGAPPDRDEPRYIYGPGFSEDAPPAGVARSLVTLYLPLGASVEGTGGDPPLEPVSFGLEGGRTYASFTVDVPAGESRSIVLRLHLAPRPEGPYELVAIPSPRVRPTSLVVDVTSGDERVAADIALDRTWIVRAGAEPAPLPAPVLGAEHASLPLSHAVR